MRTWGQAAVLVAVLGVGRSWALTAHLITGSALVNHAPGADFRIGTPDDLVRPGGLGNDDSGPNAHGAASYALLNGDAPLNDNPDLADFDWALFVDGTLEFTPSYTASTRTTSFSTLPVARFAAPRSSAGPTVTRRPRSSRPALRTRTHSLAPAECG